MTKSSRQKLGVLNEEALNKIAVQFHEVAHKRRFTPCDRSLVNRVEEINVLREAVYRAVHGEGGLVFIHGEAGMTVDPLSYAGL